jgi:hypothetical protein
MGHDFGMKSRVHPKYKTHTTLARCRQHLDVDPHLTPTNEPTHLIVDSTKTALNLIDDVEGYIASFTIGA